MTMEASFIPPSPVPEKKTSFPWVGTIILGIILLAVVGFSWRVFSFYRGIQNGSVTAETAYASSRPSTAVALQTLVAKAQGSGELATADDPMLGNLKAPLTIVEFGDFGCPFTRDESYVMRALALKFPDTIRYIYRDYPIDELHTGATFAAEAGYCAHQQGKFWEYHDTVFLQDNISEESILAAGEKIGLQPEIFSDCLASVASANEVETDLADGYAAGVRGTPTFFLNGEMVEGAIPYDIFLAVIKAFSS